MAAADSIRLRRGGGNRQICLGTGLSSIGVNLRLIIPINTRDDYAADFAWLSGVSRARDRRASKVA